MVSQSKLIKNGIQYTDALFEEIINRLQNGVNQADTLEEFLVNNQEYTSANPLVSSGYQDTMINLILSETNNHKFSRPSQRELTRVTIGEQLGTLISNVGEDVKQTIRSIVTEEYGRGSNPQVMAKRFHTELGSINKKRARVIARTEIARTSTISDYIISKEQGATHYTVGCRSTRCPICKDLFCESSETGGDVEYSIEDTEHLPPVHPNCYMPDTYLFTKKGWKLVSDVCVDDELLSLNPQSKETEFVKPLKLISHDNVDGFMYHIHNKWFDCCVTPDHDCFIYQRKDHGKKGRSLEYEFRKPYELNSESRFLRVVNNTTKSDDILSINGLKFKSKDYALLLAWYLSEGSVLHNPTTAKNKNYPIKISQSISENRKLLTTELTRICDYLNLKLYIGKEYFEIHSKELYDYLLKLGYSHEKYIPKELFGLNKECLNIFLDNYVLGDGHERVTNCYGSDSVERALFTSSKQLRDGLSYVILLAGYCPSISVQSKSGTVVTHKNGEYVQNHDVFKIMINKSKYANFSSCVVDKIKYSGKVYCVELPKYHTLWTMRDGKTSWNGNCRCVADFYKKKGYNQANTDTVNTDLSQTDTVEGIAKSLKLEYEDKGDYFKLTDSKNDVKIEISKQYSMDGIREGMMAYDNAPNIMKESVNKIEFLNGGPGAGGVGIYQPWNKTVRIGKDTMFDGVQNTIHQTVSHEMSHALDYALAKPSRKKGLDTLSVTDKKYNKIFRSEGVSSYYVTRWKGPTKGKEDFAEAVSMVINKNNPANCPMRMPNGEILQPKEWCDKFPQKTAYIEKVLGLI